MVVMVMMAADRLGQILDVGELAGLRGVRKIGGKLVELGRRCGVAIRLGSLGGALQIRGDLLGNLLVLGRVRLLQLLERAHQLGEWRKLAVVRLLHGRQRADAAQSVVGVVGGQAGVLEHAAENRLQIAVGKWIYGTGAHVFLIGILVATLEGIPSY